MGNLIYISKYCWTVSLFSSVWYQRGFSASILDQWRRTPKNLGVARGCGAQAGDAPGGPGGYRGRRRRGDAARRDMASAIPRHTRPSATECRACSCSTCCWARLLLPNHTRPLCRITPSVRLKSPELGDWRDNSVRSCWVCAYSVYPATKFLIQDGVQAEIAEIWCREWHLDRESAAVFVHHFLHTIL